MRVAVKETEVYKFDELDEDAQEKALMWYCETLGSIDYDFVIEDVKRLGAIIGIEIKDVLWSGFGSQGDGACFVGEYSYKKGCEKNLKDEVPNLTDLHNILTTLNFHQKKHFYKLSATIEHGNSHYYHYNSVTITVYKDGDELWAAKDYTTDAERSAIEDITSALRDFCRWIYKSLEEENDFLCSKGHMQEMCDGNDWEFTKEGRFYS